LSYNIESLSSVKRYAVKHGSNIPSRFLGLEPSDIESHIGKFPKEIENWISMVLEGKIIKNTGGLGETGVGLLFDGTPGLGKTTHAVVAAMELIRRLPENTGEAGKLLGATTGEYNHNFRSIYYLTFPEFLSRKKAMMDAEPDVKRDLFREMEGFHGRAKEDWLNVRVLILDDLGKEYGSRYNDSSFDEILRSRYDKALPTIITTNVPLNAWSTQYGEAMASFAYEAFLRIQLEGKDLRKN
jgi:DNA replication protein DnaC